MYTYMYMCSSSTIYKHDKSYMHIDLYDFYFNIHC